MHIYEYIQHPCTSLHLTGRAPKPVKVNDGRVTLLWKDARAPNGGAQTTPVATPPKP